MEKLAALTYGKSFLIGLAIGAFYFFVFYNDGSLIQNNINKGKTEIDKLTNEVKAIDAAVKDAERFNKAVEALGEEMQVIQKAIPAELTSTELMRIVSTEAKAVGVQINSLAGSGGTTSNAPRAGSASRGAAGSIVYYEPITVTVSLTGKYNQMMLFLSNLTKLDKIITSKNIKISADRGKSATANNPDIQMSATLLAYKYKVEVEPSAKPGARVRGGRK